MLPTQRLDHWAQSNPSSEQSHKIEVSRSTRAGQQKRRRRRQYLQRIPPNPLSLLLQRYKVQQCHSNFLLTGWLRIQTHTTIRRDLRCNDRQLSALTNQHPPISSEPRASHVQIQTQEYNHPYSIFISLIPFYLFSHNVYLNPFSAFCALIMYLHMYPVCFLFLISTYILSSLLYKIPINVVLIELFPDRKYLCEAPGMDLVFLY